VASNRDESLQRPTQPAYFWDSGILAGKDLVQGGTWIGLSKTGRFAAVTNFREQSYTDPTKKSRGALVTDFLHDTSSPTAFVEQLDKEEYGGFNLIVGEMDDSFIYCSNRTNDPVILEKGVIYGLSNGLLDEFAKVNHGKMRLQEILGQVYFSF
jgi:uncharacterized protein with NRDE domain